MELKTPPSCQRPLVLIKERYAPLTIGYRADIDALPVTEATGYHMLLRPRVMHACTTHMTVARGVLSYF